MKDQHGNPIGMPLDPLTYIGRVARDDTGKVIAIEVFYEHDVITIEDGDEFVTFTTRVLLEEGPAK